MRILFMGTPDFAVPSLRKLWESGHDICAVFTQPDKPKNRGMKLQATPVKEYALSKEIPVFQPVKLRDSETVSTIKALAPELIVVAAYGKILPTEVLNIPPKGCINVHSSLLPKYRGAAPINWAILNGETESGVTIMYMAEGLDTGDIIDAQRTAISQDENAQQLHDRLAEMGADLVAAVVQRMDLGAVESTVQDDALSCYAPMLSKDLSKIEWNKTAIQVHNQVRGLYPWPSAVAEIDGIRCKILRTKLTEEATDKSPGAFVQADKFGFKVACGEGSVLEILELQPDGKKRMAATAFLLGHPIKV